MAKAKAKITKTSKPRTRGNRKVYNAVRGCLVFVVGLVVLAAIASGSKPSVTISKPDIRLRPTETGIDAALNPTEPLDITTNPTVANRSGFVTITPGIGTIYPTATITDTPQPTATYMDLATATDVPQSTATAVVQPINSEMYYTTRDSKVRKCASTTCDNLGIISAGKSIVVTGSISGEEVTAGNVLWYQVQYGGQVAYIYSPALTKTAPIQLVPTVIPEPAVVQPISPIQSQSFVCPSNCAGARDMGLSPQQAASCGLDRDGDGEACYDDK
jgi:hypothetical protein